MDRAQARLRAEVILKVRSGQLTASEAAKQLGVSRKTYYKWEQRGLEAMLEGLYERTSGRPAREPDEEKERLQSRIQELERELQLVTRARGGVDPLHLSKTLQGSVDLETAVANTNVDQERHGGSRSGGPLRALQGAKIRKRYI